MKEEAENPSSDFSLAKLRFSILPNRVDNDAEVMFTKNSYVHVRYQNLGIKKSVKKSNLGKVYIGKNA